MKTFIISMDTPNGRSRLAKLREQCAKEGLDDIQHIEGVDGKTAPQENVGKLCQIFCTSVMIGCGLSHMRFWNEVVRQDLPYALVLEDDAVLLPNFKARMMAAIHHVPNDHHILLLGCFVCGMSKPAAVDGKGVRDMRRKHFGGTHAYIVSQKGARFLVNNVPRVNYHIDVQLARVPGIRIYATKTNLAVQNGEDTSSNAELGFPVALNGLLSKIKDRDEMSLAFYLNAAIARVGTMKHHVTITGIVLLFFLLGILRVPWTYIAIYSVGDMAFYPPGSLKDPMTKLAFYGLGLQMRNPMKLFMHRR